MGHTTSATYQKRLDSLDARGVRCWWNGGHCGKRARVALSLNSGGRMVADEITLCPQHARLCEGGFSNATITGKRAI